MIFLGGAGLAAIGGGAVGALFLLDYVANLTIRPRPRDPGVAVPDLGIRHEDLVVVSGEHRLKAWLLYPARDDPDRPLVLMTHGWGASHETLLTLARALVEGGCAVLLFDVRGHGRNDEVATATIRQFRDDVMAVARFARERFPGRPLVFAGHSLGGAAGVLAAAEGTPLDGLVLLATPANVLEVTADYLRDRGFPGRFMVVALRPFWWIRLGGTFRNFVPERKIARLRLPILIVQPELDRRVPMAHAERLARTSDALLKVIPGAGHTDFLGLAATHRAVLDFLERVASGRERRSDRGSPSSPSAG